MKAIMIYSAGVVVTAAVMFFTTGTTMMKPDGEKDFISFSNDVFPVIESNCLPCHLREERNLSRLFMDNYELLMKGGFNGPPVKPGNADESLLIQKVKPDPPFGERMPMRGKRYLTDEEINTLVQWINQGAKDN